MPVQEKKKGPQKAQKKKKVVLLPPNARIAGVCARAEVACPPNTHKKKDVNTSFEYKPNIQIHYQRSNGLRRKRMHNFHIC
jgi:hypothetical protein